MKNNKLQNNKNLVVQTLTSIQSFWIKTLCLFLFSAFMIQNAKAQYFSTLYGDIGSTSDVYLTDGITTTEGNYLMTGKDLNTGELVISLADNTGSTSTLSYTYPLIVKGNNVEVRNSKCIQHPNSTINKNLYIVVCEAVEITLGDTYLLYMDVDNLGNIGNLSAFEIISNEFKLGNITLGNTVSGNTDLYITGSANNGTEERVFTARIDISASSPFLPTYNWDGIYDVTNLANRGNIGMDIIVNLTNGNNDVLVVGQTNTGQIDAFMLPINKNTGVPNISAGLPPSYQAIFWGFNNNNTEFFQAITAGDPTQGTFIISGNTHENAGNDMWAVKVNGSGYAQVWSTYRGYSSNYSTENYGIVSRINTMGNYEYYQVGTIVGGGVFSGTSTDMTVYKIDDSGNGVANGQYTYLAGPNWSWGKAIDIDLVNTDIGLTIFGTTSTNPTPFTSQWDMNMVKAYFNGVSCNYDSRGFGTDNSSVITASNRTISTPIYSSLSSPLLRSLGTPVSLTDGSICSTNYDPNGSNNLVIQKEPKNEGLIFSPNPFDNSLNSMATIEITGSNVREITIAIYDMLGREYYTGKMIIGKNENRLNLDLTNIQFVPGMYMLHTDDTQIHKTTMIQIK